MTYVYRPLPLNATDPQFRTQLAEDLRQVSADLQSVFKGRQGYTAAPGGGNWKRGDFVSNSTPSEAGSSPNKYVVIGWICVASGSPGTWLECRCLTGN